MATSTGGFYVGIADRNEKFDAPSGGYYVIEARNGNDYVISAQGDDLIYGGFGKDLLLGGLGNDTIYGDSYVVDDTLGSAPELSAGADAILGGSGFDQIFAGGGSNFVDGGSEADFIFGGAGNEHLNGGIGNDRIYGQGGNDRLFGGTASTSEMNSFVSSNFGTIIVSINGLNDQTLQPSEQVTAVNRTAQVLTSTGDDYLDSGAGDDYIDGQDGADTMIGGVGNDTYVVDDFNDQTIEYEFEGIDEIYTSLSTSLLANLENVTLINGAEASIGNALNNRINGNSANNYLKGAEGTDQLFGGAGNDRLFGGTGALDELRGGAGDDRFLYETLADAGDKVLDFSSSAAGDDDAFSFSQSSFGGALGTLAANQFQSSVADTAGNSDIRFIYETDTNILRYDADGIGGASAIVITTLQAGAIMTNADIIII